MAGLKTAIVFISVGMFIPIKLRVKFIIVVFDYKKGVLDGPQDCTEDDV